MTGDKIYRRIQHLVGRVLPKIAEGFVERQVILIGRTPDTLVVEDIPILARNIKVNSMMLIGRTKAEKIYDSIMAYYYRLTEEN